MPKDKRKICVWIPENLYQEVAKAGYNGPTSAVTDGLKFIVGTKKTGMSTIAETMKSFLSSEEGRSTLVSNLLSENEKLKKEVEKLIEDLQKAPDPIELAELRTTITGLKELLEEKDKRIEDLSKSVDQLSVFANYFKTLNQNK